MNRIVPDWAERRPLGAFACIRAPVPTHWI
jgi:hypothetical protein